MYKIGDTIRVQSNRNTRYNGRICNINNIIMYEGVKHIVATMLMEGDEYGIMNVPIVLREDAFIVLGDETSERKVVNLGDIR